VVVDVSFETGPSQLCGDNTSNASIRKLLDQFHKSIPLIYDAIVLKDQGGYRVDNDPFRIDLLNTSLYHLDESCHRELLSTYRQSTDFDFGWEIPDWAGLEINKPLLMLKIGQLKSEVYHFLEHLFLVLV